MRKTRRRKRSLTRVKWFFAIILAGIFIAVAVNRFGDFDDSPKKNDNILYVMLLGVDRRNDDTGRSDTLMVAAIDKANHTAQILSVPRDTRVAIEGHGYDKINHAFAYGGQKLTQQCIENLLDVKIDNYIMVDTHAFEHIIDALGGVDINVEKRMYYEDPWDDNGGLVIDLYPGEQHLDGMTAEQYVRYRDGEGDIGRINRQQKFMNALLQQVVNPAIITRLPEILDRVKSSVETDMTAAELANFASEVRLWHDNGLAVATVPGTPAYFEDVSYWLPDIVKLRTEMATKSGVADMQKVAAKAQIAAAKYADDLPKVLKDNAQDDIDDKTGAKDEKGQSPDDKEKNDKADGEEKDAADKRDDRDDNGEKQPPKPEKITVMVINSSGINGAGAEVAKILQQKGFVISGVETGKTDSRENTTITTAADNTDIFYGMPFECLILDGGDENQAVVNIGRDYVKASE